MLTLTHARTLQRHACARRRSCAATHTHSHARVNRKARLCLSHDCRGAANGLCARGRVHRARRDQRSYHARKVGPVQFLRVCPHCVQRGCRRTFLSTCSVFVHPSIHPSIPASICPCINPCPFINLCVRPCAVCLSIWPHDPLQAPCCSSDSGGRRPSRAGCLAAIHGRQGRWNG